MLWPQSRDRAGEPVGDGERRHAGRVHLLHPSFDVGAAYLLQRHVTEGNRSRHEVHVRDRPGCPDLPL